MIDPGKTAAGRFCWVDLAATDADSAKDFYGRLFGWAPYAQAANGGTFTRLRLADQDVGSMYQLRDVHLDHGVPSHWTPYVRVDNADETVRRAAAIGGQVIVRPFVMSGVARIALVMDSVGAHIGLWEPIRANGERDAHG